MTMHARLLPALLCLGLLSAPLAFAEEEGDADVHIGVLAYRGAEHALLRWQPLAEALHTAIPELSFSVTPLSLGGATTALIRRRIDLLITNPANFVALEEDYDLAALATRVLFTASAPEGLTQFASAVVVRSGSGLRHFGDLRGRDVAAVSPRALGGFLMAWSEFRDQGIDPYTDFDVLAFLGFPQDQILRAVAAGEVDAGIVRAGLLEEMLAEGRVEEGMLEVLQPRRGDDYPFAHSTALYPEWVLAAAPWMPRERAQAVLLAVLSGQAAVTAQPGVLKIDWTAPASYAPVRRLLRAYAAERAGAEPPGGPWPWIVAGAAAAVVVVAAATYFFDRLRPRPAPAAPGGAEARRARRRLDALTQREREVLALVARGASTKAVANELGISVKTVEFHRGNLLKKTGARSAAELARLATLAASAESGSGDPRGG